VAYYSRIKDSFGELGSLTKTTVDVPNYFPLKRHYPHFSRVPSSPYFLLLGESPEAIIGHPENNQKKIPAGVYPTHRYGAGMTDGESSRKQALSPFSFLRCPPF